MIIIFYQFYDKNAYKINCKIRLGAQTYEKLYPMLYFNIIKEIITYKKGGNPSSVKSICH